MVDYSKWKDIEISDDEDETHPNVDTPSLFRWRHEARVEKMKEVEKEKAEFQRQKNENASKLKEIKEKYENASKEGLDCKELKTQLDLLEKEKKKIIDQDEELKKKEKVLYHFKD